MKDIEDKLDGFEQVLAILVGKISVMESLITDRKVRSDDLAHQMLIEIQSSLTKMPSGSMMLSELIGIRKRVDALVYSQEKPKPMTLSFMSKTYFGLLAIFLSNTVASFAVLKFSSHSYEQDLHTAVKYEAAQRLAPRLTRLIDNAFDQSAVPSLDSLQQTWKLLNVESQKVSSGS